VSPRTGPPPAQPILGIDPSFRYLGAVIGEAPEGFYTREVWSETAKRPYEQHYAWAVEQFNLRWWECIQVTSKELAKITPEAIPPRVNSTFDILTAAWEERYPTVQPRIAFEWSFVGVPSVATANHLTYLGALYCRLFDWSKGNIIRVGPPTHQRFFYRYAGVRLFGQPQPKNQNKSAKHEIQTFVDQLHTEYWQTAGAHPVSPTKNYRSGKKSTKAQYEAVADAVSVAVCAAARWEELKSGT
jgi:hypothetical protein